MINMFNNVPDKFFSIFSGSNREKYQICITALYERTGEGAHAIAKEDTIELLTKVISKHNLISEDEDGNIMTVDKTARYFFNTFVECGWLEVEEAKNFTYDVYFNEYAIGVLDAIYIKDVQTADELGSYVLSIAKNLSEIEGPDGYLYLESSSRDSKKFFKNLRILYTNIKKYIQRAIEHDGNQFDLIKLALDDYQNVVIDKQYHNLRTNRTPLKSIPEIKNGIELIEENDALSENLIRQCCEYKGIPFNDALELVQQHIDEINLMVQETMPLMDQIERKNSKYLQTTYEKFKFINSDNKNMVGILQNIIKKVDDDKIDLNDIVSYTPIGLIESDSLYRQPKPRSVTRSSVVVETEENLEEQKAFEDRLKQLEKYKRENIELYFEQFEDENGVVPSEKLPIKDDEDLNLFIYSIIYAHSKQRNRSLCLFDEHLNRDNKLYRKFEIRRDDCD